MGGKVATAEDIRGLTATRPSSPARKGRGLQPVYTLTAQSIGASVAEENGRRWLGHVRWVSGRPYAQDHRYIEWANVLYVGGEARELAYQGLDAHRRGDLGMAHECYQQGYERAEAAQDFVSQGLLLYNQGEVERLPGHPEVEEALKGTSRSLLARAEEDRALTLPYRVVGHPREPGAANELPARPSDSLSPVR
jgi:hypothetical protein